MFKKIKILLKGKQFCSSFCHFITKKKDGKTFHCGCKSHIGLLETPLTLGSCIFIRDKGDLIRTECDLCIKRDMLWNVRHTLKISVPYFYLHWQI